MLPWLIFSYHLYYESISIYLILSLCFFYPYMYPYTYDLICLSIYTYISIYLHLCFHDAKRIWNATKPVVLIPEDDVVSLIHVLEVDAVSARDAAQQRLLEAFACNGERVRFAMGKRTFESREIVLRRSLESFHPPNKRGLMGCFSRASFWISKPAVLISWFFGVWSYPDLC